MKYQDFKDQTDLVTGGASGIDEALVRAFDLGCKLYGKKMEKMLN